MLLSQCYYKLSRNVRSTSMGNKGNLWKAVKVARDLNVDSLPKNLTLGGETHCRE